MKKKRIVPVGKRGKTIAAVAVGILLVLGLLSAVGARYLYKENSRGYVKAKEFYFTSSLLDGASHTLAPGSTAVTFTLGNHPDALRYSEAPIAYTVKIDGAAPQGTNLAGTLDAGSVQDQTVTITNLQPGTYTVTAEGKGGYHKTLTATLVVPAQDRYLYKHLDTTNSEYVLLTVWAKGVSGTVTVSAPASLIPDNTDSAMRTAQTGLPFTDSESFVDSGYCSHVYRFFGSGVTADDFSVTCSDITAIEKAPN